MYRAVLQYHVHTERLSKIYRNSECVHPAMKFCHCSAMMKDTDFFFNTTHVICNSN